MYHFQVNKNIYLNQIKIYIDNCINVIDNCISAPLLISGSADYSVCLLNYENGKILSKLGSHSDSVECVKFNKLYNSQIKYTNYVSSSSLDGMINIWDLNNVPANNMHFMVWNLYYNFWSINENIILSTIYYKLGECVNH